MYEHLETGYNCNGSLIHDYLDEEIQNRLALLPDDLKLKAMEELVDIMQNAMEETETEFLHYEMGDQMNDILEKLEETQASMVA